MRGLKLILAYEGTAYAGWQKNRSLPTIEGALQAALERLMGHPVALMAASRTDAGVHAQGQVVHCHVEKWPEALAYRLNALLPRDIRVHAAEEVPLSFHATLQATKKEYTYALCFHPIQLPFERHISWHFPYALDLNAMRTAAQELEGVHDFSALCNERALWDRNPVCHLEKIEIKEVGEQRLLFSFTGDHFLYKMARNLAGLLAHIGCGKCPTAARDILASAKRQRAGVTAPAHGLVLQRVFYDSSPPFVGFNELGFGKGDEKRNELF